MTTTKTLYHSIAFVVSVLLVSEARSTERDTNTQSAEARAEIKEETKENNSRQPDFVSYTDNGITFSAGDYSLSMLHRLQFRYAGPFDADPRSVADLNQNTQSFMVRRARLKLAGNAYKPWIKFYIQYDWSQPVLRDFHITLDRFAWLTLRIGRGKVIYNDERVSSSGYQQFVNRSILNDIFTVDRQQGLQLMGRFFENTAADFNYVLGVFTGRGVGERLNDDENLMYAARLEWNAAGGMIKFSQSDYKFTPRFMLNFALAAATNRTNCTAFETDAVSCRTLPGASVYTLAGGEPVGSYQVDQAVFEVRSAYKGFYFKHEAHAKRIRDRVGSLPEAKIWGALVQAGVFPHTLLSFIPPQLETAARFSFIDMNSSGVGVRQEEYSGVLNWFERGHWNKISFEVTHHRLKNPTGGYATEERYRAQWDISF